jgi:eukaryotic-like serine/threonine-protein kinase
MVRFAPVAAVIDRLRQDLGHDFEFVQPLGDAGVSEVFLAREKALDRPVAIKLLRRVLSMDEISRKRILREARVAAKIHSHAVVAIHRVGKFASHGQPYLVMEYMDGSTSKTSWRGAGGCRRPRQ